MALAGLVPQEGRQERERMINPQFLTFLIKEAVIMSLPVRARQPAAARCVADRSR